MLLANPRACRRTPPPPLIDDKLPPPPIPRYFSPPEESIDENSAQSTPSHTLVHLQETAHHPNFSREMRSLREVYEDRFVIDFFYLPSFKLGYIRSLSSSIYWTRRSFSLFKFRTDTLTFAVARRHKDNAQSNLYLFPFFSLHYVVFLFSLFLSFIFACNFLWFFSHRPLFRAGT